MKASEAARALGRLGGRARAQRLTADERAQIASLGGRARSLSRHAARRITDNFSYLKAADTLRRRPARLTRMRTFDGPLPGALPATKPDARTGRSPRHHR